MHNISQYIIDNILHYWTPRFRYFFVMLSVEFLLYGFSLFPSLFIKNDFTGDITTYYEKLKNTKNTFKDTYR